ncbi:Hypothetical predicted protein [Paramuricea clavata]|uniref:Uncharacterized protein n=1 Tax=Paramuricea clavata TaxID=317549 RepID=A0A6S7LQZ9_PARCT|nr:Hypothetical predicted protein [Paramuricea clavata]
MEKDILAILADRSDEVTPHMKVFWEQQRKLLAMPKFGRRCEDSEVCNILNERQVNSRRFAATTDKEVDELVSNAQAHSTKAKTIYAVNIFKEWAKVRQTTMELHEMDNVTLDNHLRLFYAEVKNQDGDDYSKSTLLGLRHGLGRYLNSPPHNKGIKISGNPEFKKSNVVLNAKLKSLKQGGKENVQHKPPLEPEDLQKLKTSGVFDCSSPLGLLRNVWFSTVLFWCRRGREGQRNLTRESFVFAQDPTGEEYATMTHSEASKNHPGGIKDSESFQHIGRMYQTNEETTDTAP